MDRVGSDDDDLEGALGPLFVSINSGFLDKHQDKFVLFYWSSIEEY